MQILIASLPQNIAYLTGGYVSVGQNVLCSSQAYVAYLLPEGKLYCIVGHAEIPSVLEFEGGNAEIVPFGAFRFAYADTFPKPPDIPSMSRKQRAPHYRRFSIRFASWSRADDMQIALDTTRMPYETTAGILAAFPTASVSGAAVFV